MHAVGSGEYLNISDLMFSSNNSLEIDNSPVYTVPPFKLSLFIMNFVLTGVCVIIVLCDLIAAEVLRRCKRIPYQCLQLSISYILSDIVGMVLFIIHEILIFGIGLNTEVIHQSRIFTVAVMKSISSASLTAIILERVFALKANLKYTLALKRINVHLFIAVIWLAHVLFAILTVSLTFYFKCNWASSECDIHAVSKVHKYYFLTVTILYDVIMVIANTFVYKVARRHATQIDAVQQAVSRDKRKYPDRVSQRQYSSMVVFIKVVTAYLFLQTPLILTMIVSTNYPELRDETPMRIVRSFAYLCFLINSFVNLYLYIWKIQECKMNVYFILAKFFKRYGSRANVLRIQVYNIVISCTRDVTDV